MTALRKLDLDRTSCHDVPDHGFSPEAWAELNRLRLRFLQCRSSARIDMFRACSMLTADRSAEAEACAEALLRSLPQVLGHAPRVFRPGAAEISFDEAWLLRLIEAARTGDEASFTFGLCARLPVDRRRMIGFLIRRIADNNRQD